MCDVWVVVRYASRDGSALRSEEAGALFLGLVDAVGYLHANGLCHGDLKLSNVMLDGPILRIIDFGTARGAEPSPTAPPPLPGTLPYMSPEALDGGFYDGRPADVWALGVVLCNLLDRGDFPFGGRGEEGLRASIQSAPPRLPDGVSERLADLIQRMLTKDPAKRISISEVRSHPWIAAAAARGRDSRDPMVAADYSANMHHLLRAAA